MARKKLLPVNKLPTMSIAANPAPKPSKTEMERERRYRAEDAMRDLERAEGHKKDKDLMADVKQIASEKIDCLKRIK